MPSPAGMIAHRGYSKVHPENTLQAFAAAMAWDEGAYPVVGIELDIQLTGDGRIIVLHDYNLTRQCGCDLKVREHPYDTIVRQFIDTDGLRGLRPPLLEDVLELVSHATKLYIEIKDYGYDLDVIAGKLVDLLKDYQLAGDIVIHSFSPEALQAVMNQTDGLDLRWGLLFSSMGELENAPAEMLGRLDYLHPKHVLLPNHYEAITAQARPINPWVINSQDRLKQLLSLDKAEAFECIITDDLKLSNGL